VSAQALATASLLAAFVCLATFDSEALAADSGSGSGSGSGSRTQYTKSSESPLPPRLSTWDLFGRIQRLEDTSFTKDDAKAMEARMEARMDKTEATTATLFFIFSVAYFTQRRGDKDDAKAMEVRMEARMDKEEARTQENFRISTFFTIVSLFISLAANENFVAKFFPPR
jgi:preprotein translocase subunit SecG